MELPIGWAENMGLRDLYLIVGALAILAIILLPELYILYKVKSKQLNDSDSRVDLTIKSRTTVMTAIGGFLVIISIWLGWVQFDVKYKDELNKQQIENERFVRQSQELRFIEAVGLLGSLEAGKRLAGIYGLETLAWEEPDRYHWKVLELLCAMIRERAPRTKSDDILLSEANAKEVADQNWLKSGVGVDIQAALNVLGRRNYSFEKWDKLPKRFREATLLYNPALREDNRGPLEKPVTDSPKPGVVKPEQAIELRPWLDLSYSDLAGANLAGLHLEGAILSYANLRNVNGVQVHLEHASMLKADLEGANLGEANLENAYLFMTNFEGAYLVQSNLEGAALTLANFEKAELYAANLEDANLSFTYLGGADLMHVNMENALDLTWEQLDSVEHLNGTRLPDYLVNDIEGYQKAMLGDANLEGYTVPEGYE